MLSPIWLLIHLAVLLQTLGNQRIERGKLVGELAGVKLLPPGLKGAENSGTQQAADILAHAEQHREAHQVALVGNDAANPRQHRRGEEKALPKPSRNWLNISCSGRVRIVDWLSSSEATIINASAVAVGQ